ncbi:MAG: hypothetical protein S4CHLAM37_09190 [Chlamydiia bacterium]|nr:hypothetical protein [Chlamydiia bacterium]
MTIYNIFDYTEKASANLNSQKAQKTMEKIELAEAKVGFQEEEGSKKDRFFSSLAARLFFLLLLVIDVLWGVYVSVSVSLAAVLNLITFGKVPLFRRFLSKFFLSFKRFLVCGLSLFVALFTPALGIMFACTYFLMYDKEGIEEVVPTSLQAQFKEFFTA